MLYQECKNKVTITIEPPMRAFIVGSSLMIYQAINEPRTVSKGIIIPTSAAGIYLGAMVIKLKENESMTPNAIMLLHKQLRALSPKIGY